jgi:hypothetical protein
MSYTIQQLNVGTIDGITSTITIASDLNVVAPNTITINDTSTTALVVEGGLDIGNSIGSGNPSINVNSTKIINGLPTLASYPNATDYITRGAVEELIPTAQDLESVLTVGNITGNNNIVLTGTGTLTSSGVNLTINADITDLVMSGANSSLTTTTNMTNTIGGNKLENITGTTTTNANGITLDSSAAFASSGTTATMTADTGALTLSATIGDVNINAATGGVSIDTGTSTLTVNVSDVALTAPLPQDIAGAINSLQSQITVITSQLVSYQLTTIQIITNDDFPVVKPIYWTWIETRYGLSGFAYGSPTLIFEVADNSVDIHVYNETAGVDMLAITPFAVGFHAQALSNIPTANARIYIDMRSTVGGDSGTIRGIALEWQTN